MYINKIRFDLSRNQINDLSRNYQPKKSKVHDESMNLSRINEKNKLYVTRKKKCHDKIDFRDKDGICHEKITLSS